ncbi:hypothetical protein LO935_001283 [Listeria monocytogenes]|nr:hypothetical protein [Listeria monocytogenes]
MEINIKITSVEDALQAQKVFAALTGSAVLTETAQKVVEPKAPAPKKTSNKKAKAADAEKAVSTEQEESQEESQEELSDLYKELQEVVSQLPNGKNNKKLKQFIVREFNLPNVGRLEEAHYSKVIEYANTLLKDAEPKQQQEAVEAISESVERKVTRAELEKTVYNLVNAGKREELRKTLDELGAAKISSLDESDYVKAMEALEAL